MPASFVRESPNHFSLPRRIARLGELAYNLWWAWNPDPQRLYSMIDHVLWERVYHNPVAFLRRVERANVNAATNDRYFLPATAMFTLQAAIGTLDLARTFAWRHQRRHWLAGAVAARDRASPPDEPLADDR